MFPPPKNYKISSAFSYNFNLALTERGFSPKGQLPVLPVETKRQRVNMISAINSQGKLRHILYQDTMNQQRLIQFMERLIRTSDQKVFLILDNLRVHHGKLVAASLCAGIQSR